MAGVVKNLMVRAGADFSAITKQSNKAKASMRSMATSVNQSCSMMQSAAAGLKRVFGALGLAVGVAGVVQFAKDAAAAYDAQVEGEVKLARVMRNTMGARNSEIQSILDLTSAQQQLGIIGDEVQLAGAQELATYLSLSESLQTLIPVMNDMAAQQYGYNVTAEQTTSIATMLGKVMEGQVGGLSRYGYYFDEAQEKILKYGTEAEKAAVLAEVVESSVGGMNAALASTPTGRMIQLNNTLGDIKENFGQAVRTIGTVFLPALNAVAKALAVVASLANRVAQAIASIFGGKVAGKEWKTIAGGSGGIGAAADAADDLATNTEKAGGAAKKAAEEYQQASFDTLHILKESNSSGGGGGSDDTAIDYGGGGGGLDWLEEDTGDAAESVGWLEKALQGLKNFIDSLNFEPLRQSLEKVRDACAHVGEIIKGALAWAWENVLKPMTRWTVEDALPAFFRLLGEAIELVCAVVERLQPLGNWLWESFLKPLASWAGETFIAALDKITDYLQRLTDLISENTSFKEWVDKLTPLEGILTSVATALLLVSGGMKLFSSVSTGVKIASTILSGGLAALHLKFLVIVAVIAAVIAAGVYLYTHWDEIKKKCAELKENLEKRWTEIRESVTSRIEELKVQALEKWENLKNNVKTKVDTLKTNTVTGFNNLKASAVSSVETMRSTLVSKFTTLKDNALSKIEGLRSSAASKFEALQGKVSSVIETIKGLFNFNWQLPHLSVPHISWTYEAVDSSFARFFGITSIPRLSVNWYAKGGIVDGATLIGAGEAGKEAIIPLERNTEWISRVAEQLHGMLLPSVNASLGESLREIMDEQAGNAAVVSLLRDILDAVLEGQVLELDKQRIGKLLRRYSAEQGRAAGYV